MSLPSSARWRHLVADLTPLHTSAPYRRIWIGQLVSSIGTQMTAVALPIQVYALTRSAFAVGLIGMAQLVPLVLLGLVGGALVDAVDRRRVLLVTSTLLGLGSAVLAALAIAGLRQVWPLYLVAAFQAAVSAVDAPARGTIAPRLLPQHQILAASALGQLAMNTGLTAGPLAAGLLIALFGLQAPYLLDVLSYGYALYSIVRLPPMPLGVAARAPGLESVVEGLRWLRHQPLVLASFLLDLDAMIFGMPRALFPAFAAEQYGAGAEVAGVLYAAPAIGALLAGVLSGPVGRIRRQGLGVTLAIAVWGLAIAGFGVAPWPWLGALLLALAGGADLVSSVLRNTILQVAAPDRMRGRLYGLFIIIVTGGPRLGDMESGTVAALTNARVSAWSGGLLCLVGLAALAAALPTTLRYRAAEAEGASTAAPLPDSAAT